MPSIKRQVAIAAIVLAGLLLVAVVVTGTVGYYRYYKPLIRPAGFTNMTARLEETLENKTVFTAPASPGLTPEQWQRYCDVEAAVETAIGPGVAVVDAQRRSLLASATRATPDVRYRDALRALGEIGTPYIRGKAAQVKAMNRARLSKAEYAWIRRQVFAAAGLALAQLDFERFRTAPLDGREYVEIRTFAPEEASRALNLSLVSARSAKLPDWLALAFFDL
jgi:hypothetical protein